MDWAAVVIPLVLIGLALAYFHHLWRRAGVMFGLAHAIEFWFVVLGVAFLIVLGIFVLLGLIVSAQH